MPPLRSIALIRLMATALSIAAAITASAQQISMHPMTNGELEHQINLGDPSVIPTLMQMLNTAIAAPNRDDRHSEIVLALQGAGAFHLEEAGPRIVAIYQHSHGTSDIREQCAMAAAAIGGEPARHFLQTLRDDPAIKGRSRMVVLAALTTLGDAVARQALFDMFCKPVADATNPDADLNVAGYVIGQLDDPWFIKPLLEWREHQSDSDARDCAEMVAESVRINALPKDDLFKIAEDNEYAHGTARRYSAIDALSRKASIDDIPRVEALPEWKNLPAVRADERVRLDFGRKQTIMHIRQLHWREIK